MQFTREIHRLMLGTLLALVAIALIAAYWVITGPERLLPRDDNPRNVAFISSIQRGQIVDRDGEVLVISVDSDDGAVSREYLYPEMHSALGYYSLRYGEGGAEAAFDDLLTGNVLEDNFQRYFQQDVLHQPQQGVDVRLTLDLTVQRPLAKALDGLTGTAVVVAVPDGSVRAMVNTPSYDPNKLNETWDLLVNAPGQPFFNRALQGNYQPGNSIHTLLMTAAVLHDIPLDSVYQNATDPIEVGSAVLTCATAPPSDDLTLSEAYIYGCPAPFNALITQIGLDSLQATFNLYHLQNPVALEAGYAQPLPDETATIDLGSTSESVPDVTLLLNPVFRREEALGQGMITINPLHMAAITASFINAGNAPQPFTLLQTRPPNMYTWQSVVNTRPTLPITTAGTARQLQNLMVQSYQALELPEINPPLPQNVVIGGRAAIAFSGERTLTWFTGFARTDNRRGYAVAVVLENTDDLQLVAQIGQTALVAAVRATDQLPETTPES